MSGGVSVISNIVGGVLVNRRIYIHTGLQSALQTEKEYRKCRKRLNLVSEEDSGPQLFTADEVHKALALKKQKEEEEAQIQ